jgi:hypothetical protein
VGAASAAALVRVAVTDAFNRKQVDARGLLEDRWIVDDHELLPDVVCRVVEDSR